MSMSGQIVVRIMFGVLALMFLCGMTPLVVCMARECWRDGDRAQAVVGMAVAFCVLSGGGVILAGVIIG